jgi:hypothetical protein
MDIRPSTGLINPFLHFGLMFVIPGFFVYLFAYQSLRTIKELRQGQELTAVATSTENVTEAIKDDPPPKKETLVLYDTIRQKIVIYDTVTQTITNTIYDTKYEKPPRKDDVPYIPPSTHVLILRDSLTLLINNGTNCNYSKTRFKNYYSEIYDKFRNELKQQSEKDVGQRTKIYESFIGAVSRRVEGF